MTNCIRMASFRSSDLAYTFTPTGTTTGDVQDAPKMALLSRLRRPINWRFNFAPYNGKNFQFEPAADRPLLLGQTNL